MSLCRTVLATLLLCAWRCVPARGASRAYAVDDAYGVYYTDAISGGAWTPACSLSIGSANSVVVAGDASDVLDVLYLVVQRSSSFYLYTVATSSPSSSSTCTATLVSSSAILTAESAVYGMAWDGTQFVVLSQSSAGSSSLYYLQKNGTTKAAWSGFATSSSGLYMASLTATSTPGRFLMRDVATHALWQAFPANKTLSLVGKSSAFTTGTGRRAVDTMAADLESGAMYLAAIPSSTGTPFVINEFAVCGNQTSSATTYNDDEWIEVINRDPLAASIYGYTLSYLSVTGSSFSTFVTVNATSIAGRGGLYLAGGLKYSGTLASQTFKIQLANGGASIMLSTSEGVSVDVVGYGSSSKIPQDYEGAGYATAPACTQSSRRKVNGHDTDNNNLDFVSTATPSPGKLDGSVELLVSPALYTVDLSNTGKYFTLVANLSFNPVILAFYNPAVSAESSSIKDQETLESSSTKDSEIVESSSSSVDSSAATKSSSHLGGVSSSERHSSESLHSAVNSFESASEATYSSDPVIVEISSTDISSNPSTMSQQSQIPDQSHTSLHISSDRHDSSDIPPSHTSSSVDQSSPVDQSSVPAEPSGKKKKSDSIIPVAIGVAIGGAAFLAAIVIIAAFLARRRKEHKHEKSEQLIPMERPVSPAHEVQPESPPSHTPERASSQLLLNPFAHLSLTALLDNTSTSPAPINEKKKKKKRKHHHDQSGNLETGKRVTAEKMGISFSPEPLEFGTDLEIDSPFKSEVTIENTGPEALQLSIVCPFSDAFDLRAAPEIIDLESGAKTGFTLHFKGHCTTNVKCTVYIACPVKKCHSALHVTARMQDSVLLDWNSLEIVSTKELEAESARLHTAKFNGYDVLVKEWHGGIDYDNVQQVRHEIETVIALKAPAIALTHGFVSMPNKFCLVTEMPPFGTLEQFIKDNPMSPEFKVKLALNIAQGLQSLHKSGIVHRGLSPRSVIIMAMLPLPNIVNAKITEFGFTSKVGEKQKASLLFFEAPEVIEGQDPTTMSDIYSFGLVLYAVETGSSPFQKCKNKDAIIEVIESDSILLPNGPLSDYISRTLPRNPQERPTADMLVEQLAAAYALFK